MICRPLPMARSAPSLSIVPTSFSHPLYSLFSMIPLARSLSLGHSRTWLSPDLASPPILAFWLPALVALSHLQPLSLKTSRQPACC